MTTLWVSHRGESYDAPENTLAAFKLALERDTDAWETDIHFTKDNVIVCCHDSFTERTCDKNMVIAESTFDELQTLDACNKKEQYKGEKIPKFSDLLAMLPQGKLLFTEIKIDHPDIVDAMMKEIDASGVAREQIIVISFHANMIKVCKERYPEMKALYLHSLRANEDGSFILPHDKMLERLEEIHADGLDGRASKEYLTPEFAAELARRDLALAIWTIDDVETAEYFLRTVKPEAITSNRAGYLQGVIEQGKAR